MHARESGNEAKCSGHDVQQQGLSGEEDGSLRAGEVSVPAGARDRVSRHSQTRLYQYLHIHCRSGRGLLCYSLRLQEHKVLLHWILSVFLFFRSQAAGAG